MRTKGYPKGRLNVKEKNFFARRRASIEERRRKRKEKEDNSGLGENSKKAESVEAA